MISVFSQSAHSHSMGVRFKKNGNITFSNSRTSHEQYNMQESKASCCKMLCVGVNRMCLLHCFTAVTKR